MHMADSDSLPKVEHEKDSDILSTVDEKKLLWKIDLHVVPWLSLLYLLSFMDRGSIGNAKLYGLEKDIGITDKQYLIGLTVFFFPYAFIEPISNVFLRRLQPSIYLSSMMLVWGLVMTCHGLITNYGGLITVRFLLGVTEGGLYAGVVFYISSWYKRSEMGTRIAIFFSGATVAGAFSGLLAAAISNMDGIGGKTGWQWIFILEGLATILVAIASFWIIQDFPTTAKFLTEKERTFVVHRLQQDTKLSANGKESFRMKYVLQSLTDWQTWIGCADGPLYAFSLFTPSVINQVPTSPLGFKATEANLLSVPVYAWACLVTCAVGVLADRDSLLVNSFFFGIGLVGYIILIVSRTPALSYFAVYLAASFVKDPQLYEANSASWVACNVEGSYKRAVILATVIGFGNMNGVVTSNIYRARDTPWYRLGHGIVLAYIAIGFLSSLLYHILLKRENARRDRGERDEIIDGIDNKQAHERNGRYASVEEARIAKGDRWSGFRYTL
ncbi:major facilitator superfamily domain-containing protein [Flammula alnicola]|nr:major facilitator superfamily domain-containing protein [Flammula alnicola]